MTARKRRISLWIAAMMIAANLFSVPRWVSAAEGLCFDPKISDFDGTQEEVTEEVNCYSFQAAQFTVADGIGLSGSRGARMSLTAPAEHRVQGSKRYALKKGKSYHLSVWAKTDVEKMGMVMRFYVPGYIFDGKINGASASKACGYFLPPKKTATVGEWSQYRLSLSVDRVYREYRVGETALYAEIPANEDGSFPTGAVSEDGSFQPDGKGLVSFDAYLAICGQTDDGSWNQNVQPTPANIDVDGWYVIEEDDEASVSYARAQVAEAKVSEATGKNTVDFGSVLTVSAATGDCNPNAEPKVSYQWQSSVNGIRFTNIEGATDDRYTVQSSDGEKWIRAVVTAESSGTTSGASAMTAVSNAVQTPGDYVYDVSVSVGENGSVVCGETQYNGGSVGVKKAAWGEDVTLQIMPAEGYVLAACTVDGQPQKPNEQGELVLKQIVEDTKVEISFRLASSIPKYTLSINSNQGGTLSIDNQKIEGNPVWSDILEDTRYECIATPEEGFAIESVVVNGEPVAWDENGRFSLTVIKNTLVTVVFAPQKQGAGRCYYVATDGKDTNPGTLEQPFATLEAARNAIRKNTLPAGGVTVYLRGGVYDRNQTFTLGEQDSGRADAPIIYRAYGDEEVILHGGYDLDVNQFQKVSGEMKDLLPKEAQDKVLVASFSDLRLPDMGEYSIMGNDEGMWSPIILLDGQAMHLARYPNAVDNAQWPKMYCAPGKEGYEETNLGNGETDSRRNFTVQYDDETAKRVEGWTYGLDHIAAEGYWKFDWWASTRYVTIDKAKKQITARENKDTFYGVYKEQQRAFCFKNVYQELDEAGEYYIDIDAKKLYVYPYQDNFSSAKSA